jgi:hypothetical protein
MNIAVDGNHFHMGWAACLLGLPRERPDTSLRESDRNIFRDGWDMCNETGRKYAFEAFDAVVKQGRLTVFWAEDSKEIDK